jgi:hypothetical protein
VELDEVLAELAAADDGVRYPALILIEGWLTCRWLVPQELTRGGDA